MAIGIISGNATRLADALTAVRAARIVVTPSSVAALGAPMSQKNMGTISTISAIRGNIIVHFLPKRSQSTPAINANAKVATPPTNTLLWASAGGR